MWSLQACYSVLRELDRAKGNCKRRGPTDPVPPIEFCPKGAFLRIDFLRAPESRKASPRTTIWPNLSRNSSRIDLEKPA